MVSTTKQRKNGETISVVKAQAMVASMRRVWALRHQAGAKHCCWVHQGKGGYSLPAPQLEPASRLKSATRDVSFLRSDSRCRRYANDLSNVTPRYLGSKQKGKVALWFIF